MSIYDKSSLVLIPSGTKTGKVYSQKPVSGDGDFTFTRSSAATRVNADGFIEKETQNLLTYSNGFNSWGANNVTLASGQSGYDGSSDAWLLTTSAVAGYINRAVVNSGVQTYSIYAKAGTETGLFIRLNGGNNPRCFFNLTDGLVESDSGGVIKASIEDVGSGWYRCSIACNDTSTDARVYVASSAGSFPSTGNIYIQDAQLEQGLVARDYIETTTTAVEGGITDNVPRLDYTDSSCPALLLEPQRTNIITRSEYFGAWSSISTNVVNVVDNYGVSPEGKQNAAKLTFNGQNSWLATPLYSITQQTYTSSVWLKVEDGLGDIGAKLRVYTTGGGASQDVEITITDEWQRFDGLFDNWVAGSGTIFFVIRSNTSARSCLAYGAQLEAGSYATSYIPTYGSSVTRNEDNTIISNTGDIIGDAKGSFFIDINVDFLDSGGLIPVTAGMGTSALFYFWLQPSAKIRSEWYNGGGLQAAISTSGGYFNIGDRLKIAVAYQDNDFVMYVNGTLIGTDTSGNAPSPTSLRIGQYNTSTYSGGAINEFLAFPTRLSNEELAALTTI